MQGRQVGCQDTSCDSSPTLGTQVWPTQAAAGCPHKQAERMSREYRPTAPQQSGMDMAAAIAASPQTSRDARWLSSAFAAAATLRPMQCSPRGFDKGDVTFMQVALRRAKTRSSCREEGEATPNRCWDLRPEMACGMASAYHSRHETDRLALSPARPAPGPHVFFAVEDLRRRHGCRLLQDEGRSQCA